MTGSVTGWLKLLAVRFAFGIKIKRICRKKGFKLNKNGALWWLGKNKSGKCNFTVICGGESYCVKLIGVRSKRILFGFINECFYEIKDYTFALAHTMDSFQYEVKRKEPYCFENKAKRCIVMLPSSVKVTVRRESVKLKQFETSFSRIEIGNRDMTPEGEFYFAEKFLEELSQK